MVRKIVMVLMNIGAGMGIPIVWYWHHKLTTRLPDGLSPDPIRDRGHILFLAILTTVACIAINFLNYWDREEGR